MNKICTLISAAGLTLGIQGCTSINQASTGISQNTIDILSSLKEDASIPYGQVDMCTKRLTPENAVLCQPKHKTQEVVVDSPSFRSKADISKSMSSKYIIPERDSDTHGEEEFWTFPQENSDGSMSGDCEDHVIFHINTLKSQGVPSFALRPIVVTDINDEGHLILGVMMDTGIYILDNLYVENFFVNDIADLEEQTGYTAIQMVGNTGTFDWKKLRSIKEGT